VRHSCSAVAQRTLHHVTWGREGPGAMGLLGCGAPRVRSPGCKAGDRPAACSMAGSKGTTAAAFSGV
jgi:hypothetical protein